MNQHFKNQLSPARNAFTLIELLVVIAVVSILAGILFPVFASAREKGRASACLSNIHQLGLGILQYVQDNDETYPNGVGQTSWGQIWYGEGWAGQCMIYIRSSGIFECPSDTTPGSAQNSPVSYGYNINYIDPGESYEQPTGLADGAINAPSRSVLLFEVANVTSNLAAPFEGAYTNNALGRNLSASGNGLDNRLYAQTNHTTSIANQYATGYLGGRLPFNPQATQFASPLGRHSGGSNFLMGDCHAHWLPGNLVSSGLNAPSETCNQDNFPPIPGCGVQFQAAGTAASGTPFSATFSIK